MNKKEINYKFIQISNYFIKKAYVCCQINVIQINLDNVYNIYIGYRCQKVRFLFGK